MAFDTVPHNLKVSVLGHSSLESCLTTEKRLIWNTCHEPPPFPWTEFEWATPLWFLVLNFPSENFVEYTNLDPSGPGVSKHSPAYEIKEVRVELATPPLWGGVGWPILHSWPS